ncbi:MAG: hypothetical protein NT105_14425 [Verrucomicrobia bacterium]|nr:hypothetical protein [Verrucomicrobiota bacterium]
MNHMWSLLFFVFGQYVLPAILPLVYISIYRKSIDGAVLFCVIGLLISYAIIDLLAPFLWAMVATFIGMIHGIATHSWENYINIAFGFIIPKDAKPEEGLTPLVLRCFLPNFLIGASVVWFFLRLLHRRFSKRNKGAN